MGHENRQDRALEFAMDRTVLANERTFAAWLRTGLGALTAGLAVEKFMVDVIPFWGIRLISTTFVAFSALAFLIAAWRHLDLAKRVASDDVARIPRLVVIIVSALLFVCSVLALFGLWLAPT